MTDSIEDLNWLAQQYVLGELGAEAVEAFEARLADDEETGAALARAVQLVAALRTGRAVRVERSTSRRGWRRLAYGLAATAAAGAVVWLAPRTAIESPKEMAAVAPQRALELVSRWRDARPESVSGSDRWNEEEQDAGDDVPNWLMAAVSLEAGGATEDPVQEN